MFHKVPYQLSLRKREHAFAKPRRWDQEIWRQGVSHHWVEERRLPLWRKGKQLLRDGKGIKRKRLPGTISGALFDVLSRVTRINPPAPVIPRRLAARHGMGTVVGLWRKFPTWSWKNCDCFATGSESFPWAWGRVSRKFTSVQTWGCGNCGFSVK